jgi:antitoxin (DNA-binding transcriptional repressor) of toxin-antitoxin stability system
MADDAGRLADKSREIGVTEFKAKSLGLIDDVAKGRLTEVRLTKRGKVVARLTAELSGQVAPKKRITLADIAEAMKGTISIPEGVDVTEPSPDWDDWNDNPLGDPGR